MSHHHPSHRLRKRADGKDWHTRGWTPALPMHPGTAALMRAERPTPSQVEAFPVSFYDMSDTIVKQLGVWDQGSLGDCVVNASLKALQFLFWKENQALQKEGKTPVPIPDPSRLFGYYAGRKWEGTPPDEDSGLQIPDYLACLRNWGVCREALWAYDVTLFDENPPVECWQDAPSLETLSDLVVDPTVEAIKHQLINWWPVVFGTMIPESFEGAQVAQTGVALYPQASEQIVGGHSMLMVGWDDALGCFDLVNSWSAGFGPRGGRVLLPYAYVLDKLATNFMVLTSAKGAQFNG